MFLYQANLANTFSSPRIYCLHPLRCTALGFTLALAIFFAIHLSSPSTQVGQLGILMDQTEADIRRAMVHASRSYAFSSDFSRYYQSWATDQCNRVAKTASLIPSVVEQQDETVAAIETVDVEKNALRKV
ncbi:hypothetical protein DFH08DRAFT_1078999 [Mycena albidolilacea]|uniref:Uncharacterized protein n=1 Tax=Mycena albidolilacea TaxID=1033008 RepID=A0AAD7A7W2_9AGAR|nr:hypothetical protein DFH08DRAFT_1078999 [Mycena albidolilacea]